MKNKAIIFNCSYNGLSIIQELSRHGIECIAMDCVRGIGTFSRYAEYIKCPDPRYEEKKFIDQLYDFCSGFDEKPVLFPTNDEWALAVSKYKDKLIKVAHVCSGPYDSVRLILSKDEFYKVGGEKKYQTPKSWKNDELALIEDKSFPIVAKAKYKSDPESGSKELTSKLEKNRLIVLKTKQALREYLEQKIELLPHLVFQEYVNGYSDSMYTVGIYADRNHQVKAFFSGRKVRGFPADIGDNIVGESCIVPNHLFENTTKIVRDIKLSGIAEFEYKKDSVSDEFKLIEINPRSWSWIGITPASGVNLPLIAYKDLIGQEDPVKEPIQVKETVRYIKLYQDFVNCVFRYRLTHPQWAKSPIEWYREIKTTQNIYAELNRKDYLISFLSVFYVIAKLLSRK